MDHRIRYIDCIKTIAIAGVLFYHIGIAEKGYLGVEMFLVVSGYLFIRTNKSNFEKGIVKPCGLLVKKLANFWPLLCVSSAVSLLYGFFFMLPDDYENLAESVVATNMFANNILQGITTRDYWDIVNTYKPLMHTWYISVMVQILCCFMCILWFGNKMFKKLNIRNLLLLLSVVSVALFVSPYFDKSAIFYYFPFRMFEFTVGGLVNYFPTCNISNKKRRIIGYIAAGISICILLNVFTISNKISVLLVCFLTIAVIYAFSDANVVEDNIIYSFFSLPGKYSWDIYIWHQVVIAILYYSLYQYCDISLVVWVIVITVILSCMSISIRNRCFRNKKTKLQFSVVLALPITILSIYLYIHAGVVRDVPELNISIRDAHRNMHAEYVDVPYEMDNDFVDDDKINILVVGDSFARDFVNILRESDLSDKIEISYVYGLDAVGETDRVEQARYVFWAKYSWDVSEWMLNNIPKEKLYIVGNKSFGNSNGVIYAKRFSDGYYGQTIELTEMFWNKNNELARKYEDHYIDMMSPLLVEGTNKEIRVFTDDNYLISQDCRHLTKQGAAFYSHILDLSFVVQ